MCGSTCTEEQSLKSNLQFRDIRTPSKYPKTRTSTRKPRDYFCFPNLPSGRSGRAAGRGAAMQSNRRGHTKPTTLYIEAWEHRGANAGTTRFRAKGLGLNAGTTRFRAKGLGSNAGTTRFRAKGLGLNAGTPRFRAKGLGFNAGTPRLRAKGLWFNAGHTVGVWRNCVTSPPRAWLR
jgi:hypothetical protein